MAIESIRQSTSTQRRPTCGDGCIPAWARTVDGFAWVTLHDAEHHEEAGRQRVACDAQPLTLGALAIDLEAGLAFIAGEPLHLTGTEWLILVALARRPGALVSTAELFERVWARREDTRWTCSRGHLARVNIARIRGKLGTYADLIETKPGRGYRLRVDRRAS